MSTLAFLKIIKFGGAILAVIAALYSIFAQRASARQKRLILIAWLVGSPIFFYLEYFFQAPLLSGDELERFMALQERAGAIWAGISAALALLYFRDS